MALSEVLVDELRDMYSAENQLVKALPKMAQGAINKELKSLYGKDCDMNPARDKRRHDPPDSLLLKDPKLKSVKGNRWNSDLSIVKQRLLHFLPFA